MKDKDLNLGTVMDSIEAQDMAMDEFNRLERRFNQQKYTWVDRNERLRLVSLVCSYVFNLASAVGMLYMAKYLSSWYTTSIIAQWVVGGIVTLAFEWAKRETSDRFWDDFFRSKKPSAAMFAMNFIIIFGMSLGSAIMGYNQITKDYSPEYQAKKSNERIEELKAEKAIIHDEDKTHMANKNSKGETYYKSLQKVEKNGSRIASIDEKLDIEYAKIEQLNNEGQSNFDGSVTGGIYTILISIILFEVLFEICMRFMSYFDYRKHKELKTKIAIVSGTPPPISDIEKAIIQSSVKPTQNELPHPASSPLNGAIPIRGGDIELDRINQVMTNQINNLQSELVEIKDFVKSQAERSAANEMERQKERNAEQETERNAEQTKANKPERKPVPKRKQNGTPKWVKNAVKMKRDGMSYGEIAQKVGKSKTTVYRQLNK